LIETQINIISYKQFVKTSSTLIFSILKDKKLKEFTAVEFINYSTGSELCMGFKTKRIDRYGKN